MIIKGIRDLNDQLRTVAEGTVMYTSEREARDRRLAELDEKKVEELVKRMEAEMRAAAKELEFERAAALRDEIQQIRLRVLDQDQSAIIARPFASSVLSECITPFGTPVVPEVKAR